MPCLHYTLSLTIAVTDDSPLPSLSDEVNKAADIEPQSATCIRIHFRHMGEHQRLLLTFTLH